MSETDAPQTELPIELQLRIVTDLGAVPAEAWDACAGAKEAVAAQIPHEAPDLDTETVQPASRWAANPFVSHTFLSALERSGSATPRTGWAPHHLLAETRDGELVGAVPCYLKSHSRGEYVFDEGWADAYERAGGSYYPKLQVSVPFTPATGPRLLVKPTPYADAVKDALAAGLVTLCERRQASSAHVTFLPSRTGNGSAPRAS